MKRKDRHTKGRTDAQPDIHTRGQFKIIVMHKDVVLSRWYFCLDSRIWNIPPWNKVCQIASQT